MKKVIPFVVLLAACATPDFRASFEKSGVDEAARDRDYAACDYDASRAVAGAAAGADRGSQRTEILVKCMRMRGYRLK